MSNHTPGPWKARSKDQCVYGPAGVTVAFCGDNGIYGDESYSISKEESYGNARLIAAAPTVLKERNDLKEMNDKMLNELIRTTRWLEKNFEPTSQYLRNIHVIEKTTGKTWEEIEAIDNDR